MKHFRGNIFVLSLLAAVVGCVTLYVSTTRAQVMQSTNYRIESDSINMGGGRSTSTMYQLESTGGEIATGESSSAQYTLKAGYQQMTTNFLSMTAPGSVALTPALDGITGGESNGSVTVTVTTDSPAGYELSIAASTTPAMVNGVNNMTDYAPAGDPDFTFTTGGSDGHFGYSPSSADTVSRFKDNGVNTCNTGAIDTALACWDGLSTTQEVISRRTSANTPSGSTTTVHFRVGVGSGAAKPEGVYTAVTILTAVSL